LNVDMKYLFIVFVFFILALTPAPPGQAVYGMDVFDTKPFPCGQEHHLRWVNDIGDIHIYQSQVWMGMYDGDVADLSFQVNVSGRSNILHRGNWDHYTDPTGIPDQIQLMNWTPNYIPLAFGDTLEFIYGCYVVPGTTGMAQIVVTVWYAQ